MIDGPNRLNILNKKISIDVSIVSLSYDFSLCFGSDRNKLHKQSSNIQPQNTMTQSQTINHL